jgi:hypothetical protein
MIDSQSLRNSAERRAGTMIVAALDLTITEDTVASKLAPRTEYSIYFRKIGRRWFVTLQDKEYQ